MAETHNPWEQAIEQTNLDPTYEMDSPEYKRTMAAILEDQNRVMREIMERSSEFNQLMEKYYPIFLAAEARGEELTHIPEFQMVSKMKTVIDALHDEYDRYFDEMRRLGPDDSVSSAELP